MFQKTMPRFEAPIDRETSPARDDIRTSTGYKRVIGAPMLAVDSERLANNPSALLQGCISQ